MTYSMVRLCSPSILSEIEVSTTLEGHSERWFDFVRHRPELIEGRLKGVEG